VRFFLRFAVMARTLTPEFGEKMAATVNFLSALFVTLIANFECDSAFGRGSELPKEGSEYAK